MSFLLKVIKKLVDRYLHDDPLAEIPIIHDNTPFGLVNQLKVHYTTYWDRSTMPNISRKRENILSPFREVLCLYGI